MNIIAIKKEEKVIPKMKKGGLVIIRDDYHDRDIILLVADSAVYANHYILVNITNGDTMEIESDSDHYDIEEKLSENWDWDEVRVMDIIEKSEIMVYI